jgi:hypothetical protein
MRQFAWNCYNFQPFIHDTLEELQMPRLPVLVFLTILILGRANPGVLARDLGQWSSADPAISHWYKSLMMPDNPTISCCGDADAYYADVFETEGDQYVAVITDTREDAPLGRHHVEAGTRVIVPNRKLKTDSGNPTGHGVIFLSSSDTVFCYVAPGGT